MDLLESISKYRYRSLKEHDNMDDALFKINYDLKALQQKA